MTHPTRPIHVKVDITNHLDERSNLKYNVGEKGLHGVYLQTDINPTREVLAGIKEVVNNRAKFHAITVHEINGFRRWRYIIKFRM